MIDKPSMAASVKTRRDRRRALEIALCQITAIRDAEERYMDNIPENLCGSINYEVAEQAVSALDEIIEMMGDVY
jgi:hypothetical protein